MDYGWKASASVQRLLYGLQYRNGSGLAREGMQHNDVMYGLVCSPSRGTPPSVFLDFGFAQADGRALGLFRICPGRQDALEGPCAAMQIVRRTEDLRVWGFSTGMFSVRAGRRARARLSFLRWPVQLGGRPGASLTSIYASEPLPRSRRARFGHHITPILARNRKWHGRRCSV